MNWRLIASFDEPAVGQMAYDAELFHLWKEGQPPFLRFFFFKRPTVTLGRLEARRLELEKLSTPYEIRPTGGRAVLHGEGDLCYSIVASKSNPLVGGDLLESYRKISGLWAQALRGLGRDVGLSSEKHAGVEWGHCFSSPSTMELTWNGKKVAGGAQAREGDRFLQQGVLLLSVAPGWRSLLPREGESPMVGLNDDPSLTPLTRVDLEKALVAVLEGAGVDFEGSWVATGGQA